MTLNKQQNRTGGMLPMVAVVMIILIIGAVFSVDIAHMHMVRAELRTATDAAARAGAEAIARTQDPNEAIDAALNVARQNLVSGQGLILNRSDIVIGQAVEGPDGKFVFQEGLAPPFTSVRVTGRRDSSSAQGEVNLFFGAILGVGNFEPVQEATASTSVRDIAIVLDRSGSMRARDAGGGLTRNQALKNAVTAFIDEIEASNPDSRISVTTYASSASRDLALTANLNRARAVVNRLPASGATNIFQGLRFGSDSLEQDAEGRRFAAKTIVVMTDGNFNRGGTPVPSARVAAGRDHTIHTITFSRGANQAIMRQVADIGGGIHIHADDAGDLTEAFREIARTLSVVLVE